MDYPFIVMFLAGDCMMSGIPGFGGEESYEEPLPPHDPEDEPDYTDEAAPSHVDEYEEAEEKKADADSEDVNEASTEGTQVKFFVINLWHENLFNFFLLV